jgi:threonine/homoserine/homoserine lactone efflux protein
VRQAIGDVLPLAIAAAISPIPIIGVVLMLVTPRARTNSLAFVVGWLVGLAVVGVVGLTVASAAGASDGGESSSGADTFQVVLGVVLIAFALRQWRKRPKAGEEAAMPKWMDAVDHFTPPRAAGLGVVLSAVNPKNLLLALAAATTIASSNLPGGDQALAYAVFTLIATIGVAAPIVVSFTMGDRAASILDDLKTWLGHNNAAIMAVIFLVIGAKVLGQGIAG